MALCVSGSWTASSQHSSFAATSSRRQHLPTWSRMDRPKRVGQFRTLCSERTVDSVILSDPKGLAYLGDSVWSLYVRRHFFTPPKHWRTYQDLVQPYVTAEGQAALYDALLSGAAGATQQEQALLSQVRHQSAGWRLRKRFNSVAAAEAYRKATAFEALVGHLHLHQPDRLLELADGLLQIHTDTPPQQPSAQVLDSGTAQHRRQCEEV